MNGASAHAGELADREEAARRPFIARPSRADAFAALAESLRRHEAADRVIEVREARARLRDWLRTLEVAVPEQREAAAMVRHVLALCPRDPDRPGRRYAQMLRGALERLESHRVAAAVYTCGREGGDLRPVHAGLERVARVHGGSVCWYHHDYALADLQLERRPGWQRVARLIQQRHIGLLAVPCADELIPVDSPVAAHPSYARQVCEEWAVRHRLRLVCLTDSGPLAGPVP
ncbi:hypothetical protein ACFH04_13240 [Streptomyces noboritoensis]|uniref:Uncharacterized protein n=1 Tax=Streptomyces noboritoensis TaxID=67337 RepID=A0ABV6TFU6_9ACTN